MGGWRERAGSLLKEKSPFSAAPKDAPAAAEPVGCPDSPRQDALGRPGTSITLRK
eukprot:gene34722-14045_t